METNINIGSSQAFRLQRAVLIYCRCASAIQKTYTRSIHHTRKSAMTATITYRIHCPTVFGSVWLFTGPSYQVGVQWGWEDRISANTVLPGTMDTPANRAADPKADPLQGLQPAQVAALLVHLASDAGSEVTGAAIPIYGSQV